MPGVVCSLPLIGYLLLSKKERSAGASSLSYEGVKKFQIKGPACIMLIAGGTPWELPNSTRECASIPIQ